MTIVIMMLGSQGRLVHEVYQLMGGLKQPKEHQWVLHFKQKLVFLENDSAF